MKKIVILAFIVGVFASCKPLEYTRLQKPLYEKADKMGISIQIFPQDSFEVSRAVIDETKFDQGRAGSIKVIDEDRSETLGIDAMTRGDILKGVTNNDSIKKDSTVVSGDPYQTIMVQLDKVFTDPFTFVWDPSFMVSASDPLKGAYVLDVTSFSQDEKSFFDNAATIEPVQLKTQGPVAQNTFLKPEKKKTKKKGKPAKTFARISKNPKGTIKYAGYTYTVRYGSKPYLLVPVDKAAQIEKRYHKLKGVKKQR